MLEATRPTPQDPATRTLFPDQAEAVERLVRHLRRPRSRGLYVSATGTGKTLVSIRVADQLDARLVLFVVPTLDLAAQTALAWRSDGHSEHMVIVSSLDSSAREDLRAARIGSTSDPRGLAALMSVVGEETDQIPALTVICTYDSLNKIEETQSTGYTVPPFDLAVMDEAHRIAGRADKKWAAVNDAKRILADRRLYMTATPASSQPPNWPTPPTRPAHAAAPTTPPKRTCLPTPWTTSRCTGRRSSSTRSPKRWRTAERRTTASWCPP
ncbi:DEAD/DEAH box helicase family protein [Streptomyces sp. NBC_01635]|uniref:DEAD/DEAH box helicase family protein n=1 Tax=Streptomyces sp. NBC_01635 TaxID=2975904 RepID=UPI00386996CB|nr:DEAD/DEAH box helicase family protein [Streptomyces sp. NBC_01635]